MVWDIQCANHFVESFAYKYPWEPYTFLFFKVHNGYFWSVHFCALDSQNTKLTWKFGVCGCFQRHINFLMPWSIRCGGLAEIHFKILENWYFWRVHIFTLESQTTRLILTFRVCGCFQTHKNLLRPWSIRCGGVAEIRFKIFGKRVFLESTFLHFGVSGVLQ
jgi:hypothetical protein